jgi:tripartite-type tricarboxylate transporter receptor subunit TctC
MKRLNLRPASRRASCMATLLGLAALAAGTDAAAGDYPDEPIRMVVPYAPAGGTDELGRLLAQKVSAAVGQSVIVENRPGADGMIGTAYVAQAKPNGYTVAFVSSGHAVNPTLYRNITFDTVKDLRCVTQTAVQQIVLVVTPSLPVHSVKELIDYGKSHPNSLYFGTSSKASQLPMELFGRMTGLKLTAVPYKGSGPALTDMIAGRVQMGFIAAASAIPYIKSGHLRALAIGDDHRSPSLPDLPTVAEAGVPGFQANLWSGMFVPNGTPAPVINRLNEVLVKVVKDPTFAKTMEDHGFEPAGTTPAQCDAFIVNEIAKWATVAKDAGIVAE